jgi:hypothetical protein
MVELPDEVTAVFGNFRTAEIATFSKDGTPVAVEVTPVWLPGKGRFLASASIGLGTKAYNLRRNPKLSLLYSEPRASGLTDPPFVLVQGDATVSELTTWDDDLAEYWPVLWRYQPAGRRWGADPLTRRLMDWYYMRLKIDIVPRRIRWWPGGDMTAEPREVTL